MPLKMPKEDTEEETVTSESHLPAPDKHPQGSGRRLQGSIVDVVDLSLVGKQPEMA